MQKSSTRHLIRRSLPKWILLDTVACALAITTEDERLLSLRHPVHLLPSDFCIQCGSFDQIQPFTFKPIPIEGLFEHLPPPSVTKSERSCCIGEYISEAGESSGTLHRYQNCSRVVARRDENVFEKERRNVEILKIRFGEATLQVCEVMLKDMTDWKRIDGHVQSQKASNVHPTINIFGLRLNQVTWSCQDSSSDCRTYMRKNSVF
ncbi:uncharacterized protein LACBIDRAFT_311453 [Laccaria bicolor S238N-H82]|uniref:Predicted protein n=1 Tax=Laccaria bicolor (strain S238N-H82 / ATCC MYA-4686) TaxID=486041 RepID=B0CXE7_LACBS|nr:uncharacterized protein LACBIDRAFT_311453 [Laccaria bicolor S238N-H82]EDR12247.1 predicted protein [Laccaria bicolor S238N-H82]|eukprot:XP_001876511.1 predicted protein [Laccaria bicolor S238N-H82]